MNNGHKSHKKDLTKPNWNQYFKNIRHTHTNRNIDHYSRCSSSRPCSFILFASCCAFLFSRQILDAYLFFSRGDSAAQSAAPFTGRLPVVPLAGELMIAVSRWSSSPICCSRRGLASASASRADRSLWRRECLVGEVRDRGSATTGSQKCDSTCGSAEVGSIRSVAGWHLGPLDCTLYSQKYCFCVSVQLLLLLLLLALLLLQDDDLPTRKQGTIYHTPPRECRRVLISLF